MIQGRVNWPPQIAIVNQHRERITLSILSVPSVMARPSIAIFHCEVEDEHKQSYWQ